MKTDVASAWYGFLNSPLILDQLGEDGNIMVHPCWLSTPYVLFLLRAMPLSDGALWLGKWFIVEEEKEKMMTTFWLPPWQQYFLIRSEIQGLKFCDWAIMWRIDWSQCKLPCITMSQIESSTVLCLKLFDTTLLNVDGVGCVCVMVLMVFCILSLLVLGFIQTDPHLKASAYVLPGILWKVYDPCSCKHIVFWHTLLHHCPATRRWKVLAQPQEYSIPLSARPQWHLGVRSTSMPISLPIDCNRVSSSSYSRQLLIQDFNEYVVCTKPNTAYFPRNVYFSSGDLSRDPLSHIPATGTLLCSPILQWP